MATTDRAAHRPADGQEALELRERRAVTMFLFACILHLTGTEVPGWAWAIASGAATVEVLTSEMARAFWRGLTGQ